ncbi:DUF6599 family protein [Desulfosoma caldarium]|uniref:Uncharacterized protein n=1 Tax=Desulfosoma caldarium TaxID=610254 RepID=A0A3N1URE4_9BACT|nr:DUF6599 family protein [Desulfosoma caldarium]ROQ91137.1 hypothetical protein EDC27_2414 [Desulfosoma caldarium]
MAKRRPLPSPGERRLSWVLLGLLGAITAGVVIVSFRQDPFLSGTAGTAPLDKPMAQGPAPETLLPDVSTVLDEALEAAGPSETFDAQTLADKIDGKAELYLEAGFTSLRTQRVTLKENPQLWAEFFLFTMRSPQSAFAVFSQQRRSAATPLPEVTFGYRAANAVCAAAGPYYVEGIASSEEAPLLEALSTTVRALLKPMGTLTDIVRELQRFPKSFQAHERAVLYLGSAFGYDGFQETYAVPVTRDGLPMTAFVAKAREGFGGRQAAEAYARFLEESGARRVSGADPEHELVVLDFYGFVEVVFSHEDWVAGVHEAERREAAEGAALDLREHLKNSASQRPM